jgi:hypothetical protein
LYFTFTFIPGLLSSGDRGGWRKGGVYVCSFWFFLVFRFLHCMLWHLFTAFFFPFFLVDGRVCCMCDPSFLFLSFFLLYLAVVRDVTKKKGRLDYCRFFVSHGPAYLHKVVNGTIFPDFQPLEIFKCHPYGTQRHKYVCWNPGVSKRSNRLGNLPHAFDYGKPSSEISHAVYLPKYVSRWFNKPSDVPNLFFSQF